MKYKKVLVVLGGLSKEREVSLESGKACIKALKKIGYNVSTFDPQEKKYNLINKNETDVMQVLRKIWRRRCCPKLFWYLKIPYTHSELISSYNAMNKIISKKILKNKIKSPTYFVYQKKDYTKNKLAQSIKRKRIKFPIVVKPINEGSSIGVRICKNTLDLNKSAKSLFKKHTELLFETYIGGQEIQVAVINGIPLGAIELKPKRQFYDYKAKYSKAAKTKHIMPANLKQSKYKKVLQIAKKAHNALGCKGVTRSDFKFFRDKFYLLEINTQPGMTSLSLVPK